MERIPAPATGREAFGAAPADGPDACPASTTLGK